MRYVLRGHQEVAHYWANKVQPSGRASRMFFENGVIYSYGSHFPIAAWVNDKTIAFTTRDYSPSTGKHKGYVRQAIPRERGIELLYVYWPGDAACSFRRETEDQIRLLLESAAKRRKEELAASDVNAAIRLATHFNRYAKLRGEQVKLKVPKPDMDLKKVAEHVKKREADLKAAQARALRQREAEIVKEVALWRQGGQQTFPAWQVNTKLRISGDRVETSRGAAIPVRHAQRLWPLILKARENKRVYSKPLQLGVYTLDRINADGSIVVGCHQIAWEEIVYIAEQLKLLEKETA